MTLKHAGSEQGFEENHPFRTQIAEHPGNDIATIESGTGLEQLGGLNSNSKELTVGSRVRWVAAGEVS